MRVLIAAGTLDAVGGLQVYVRELAQWLLRAGHAPVVYGVPLGLAAEQLRRATVPVTSNLASIGTPPDIIHGHHAPETMTAMLHFPSVPAVFTCHGWSGRGTSPPHHPRLLRCIAVDDTCADRLRSEERVGPEMLEVLLNAVDTDRFLPRESPLPPRPQRALVFSNTASEMSHVPAVREACARHGIALDVAGVASGKFVDEPEAILGRYDLVFAKARCALEAMACGAAVVVCDAKGVGGLVRSADVERLRRLNFGVRTLTQPVDADVLAREIAAYDPADAERVTEQIRRTAPADALHARIVALYEEVIAEAAGRAFDPDAEGRAAAAFLHAMIEETRGHGSRLNLVVQAADRVLRTPVVGPAMTRVARWLVTRGRRR